MASREPHSGGLDWDIDDPGEHARTNEQSTGGNGWFSRPTDPTKEMAIFLVSLRKRFTGNFQGHDSAAEVRLWFTKMEDKLITRTAISNRLFPTITPALASNWAASLTTTLFTDEVPPRVTSQNNALHQSVAEYNAAVILFREVRQRFIAPLSNLLLYELVSQEKRAEIAQALTAVRGGVQEVGDVGDYIALRDLLSSPSYTLMETLDDAVWNKGVASALQTIGALAGTTRTVVLAMRREQSNLFNYATVGHAAAIAAAAGNNAASVFSIDDVNQMCARLVLGHHLKKTITPRVLETFRANRIFLIPAVAPATEPTVLLEVPLAAADVNNVVQRQDVLVRKGWLAAHSGAVGVKQVDKRAKRSAPVAVVAETAAVTSFNNSSSSGYVKRTRVERTPQRTDGAVAAHRGGARPAFNAEARPTTAGHSQRQHVHQQHRGGPAAAQQAHPQHRGSTGGPAAAGKTTAPHGRHVERFRTAGPADKRVTADYICWNCGTKGEHSVFECRQPRVQCDKCGFQHAAGRCLGYLRSKK